LPKAVDRSVIDRFNGILEDPSFYDINRKAIESILESGPADSSLPALRGQLAKTDSLRGRNRDELTAYERSEIRGLNRGLMERLYPSLITPARANETGMSLTRTGGIAANGYAYMQTLSNNDLTSGMDRMAYGYKPMATFLRSTQIPALKFIGELWNQHLTSNMDLNRSEQQQRGIYQPVGGVSLKEAMASFFRQDDWQVANLFGLAYNVMPPQNGQTSGRGR